MGVVAVVALLVLGPEKLPGAMRGLGRIYGQFSRLMAEFHRAMDPKDPHFLGNLEYKPKNKVLENLKTTESSTNAPAEPPSTPVPLDTEIEKLESEEPEKIGS
jgi:Sec-independent protein translocase protein TatA